MRTCILISGIAVILVAAIVGVAHSDAPTKQPLSGPSLKIDHKLFSTNQARVRAVEKLLGTGRGVELPGTDISLRYRADFAIRITIDGSPETCAVRFAVEAVDADGFIIEKFRMHEVLSVKGESCDTTKRFSMNLAKFMRIAVYRIADVEYIDPGSNCRLEAIKTKLVGSRESGNRNGEVLMQAVCVYEYGNVTPSFVYLQGLDKDGFEVCRVPIYRNKCIKWISDGNRLVLEVSVATITEDIGRVHTWRTLAAKTRESVLLDLEEQMRDLMGQFEN